MDTVALTTQSQWKFWISSEKVYLHLHLTWRIMLWCQFQSNLKSSCVLMGTLFFWLFWGFFACPMDLSCFLSAYIKCLLLFLFSFIFHRYNLSLNIRDWYSSRHSTTYSKHRQLKLLADLERRQLINWCVGMSEREQVLCMTAKWQVTPDKDSELNGEASMRLHSGHTADSREGCTVVEEHFINSPSLLNVT